MDISYEHEQHIQRILNARGVGGRDALFVEEDENVPYPSVWHYIGTLLRLPVRTYSTTWGDTGEKILRIWTRYGDRGWADLARYALEGYEPSKYFLTYAWLVNNPESWPSTIRQWPEETIRFAVKMHRLMGPETPLHDSLFSLQPIVRKDEREVAAMLGAREGDTVFSLLRRWGQFHHELPASSASRLWDAFMRAYRRKRRPLGYNPVSLIGLDPYIVSVRLERGEF